MAIELSDIIFSDQNDVVPVSGVAQIFNTGVANTLDGNDTITSSVSFTTRVSLILVVVKTSSFPMEGFTTRAWCF